MQAAINKWIADRRCCGIIAPRRAEIGEFHHAGGGEMGHRDPGQPDLELQVGRDLQYIRINGTVVGGLVGLIIFTVTRVALA